MPDSARRGSARRMDGVSKDAGATRHASRRPPCAARRRARVYTPPLAPRCSGALAGPPGRPPRSRRARARTPRRRRRTSRRCTRTPADAGQDSALRAWRFSVSPGAALALGIRDVNIESRLWKLQEATKAGSRTMNTCVPTLSRTYHADRAVDELATSALRSSSAVRESRRSPVSRQPPSFAIPRAVLLLRVAGFGVAFDHCSFPERPDTKREAPG
jgi:hypothetical protein